MKDYAFVHMEWAEDAMEADRGLESFQAKNSCAIVHQLLWTAPGWETGVAAVSVGKRGTGQKNAQQAVRVAWWTLPSNYDEQYGAVHTACTMGYGESIYYNDAVLRST